MKTGIGQSKYRNLTLFHVVWSVPAKVFLTVTFSIWSIMTDHDHFGSDVEQDWSYTVFALFFFTLTKQFKIVDTSVLQYCMDDKSNAEFRMIREKSDFIPVNRTRHLSPNPHPPFQPSHSWIIDNAERQWTPRKQALWLGSSTLTTTWCVAGVQFKVIFQSVLIFNRPLSGNLFVF